MAGLASILPITTLFETQPSDLRAAAAVEPLEKLLPDAPATTAAPTTVAASTAAPQAPVTTNANLNSSSTGMLGLVHTSLAGLTNYVKNLPQRLSLLGE